MPQYIEIPKPTELTPTHTGEVVHYNVAMQFGFIRDDASGEDVFFHRDRMRAFWLGKQRVKFAGFTPDRPFIRRGDRVVYVLRSPQPEKGRAVHFWNFEQEYQFMQQEMQQRPLMRLVRNVTPLEGERESTVQWKGRDLYHLRRWFPVNSEGVCPIEKPALGQKNRSVAMLLEVLQPDGYTWQRMHHVQQSALVGDRPLGPQRFRFACEQPGAAPHEIDPPETTQVEEIELPQAA